MVIGLLHQLKDGLKLFLDEQVSEGWSLQTFDMKKNSDRTESASLVNGYKYNLFSVFDTIIKYTTKSGKRQSHRWRLSLL